MRIVLIGEAWGQSEDRFRHPFVGPTGRQLATMLAEAKIAPEVDFSHPNELDMVKHWTALAAQDLLAVTNVFQEHPQDNRLELFFTSKMEGDVSIPPLKPGHYIRKDKVHHLYRLWAEIQAWEPNLIIALGNAACWATLGRAKISEIRGTTALSSTLGRKVFATYHPAAVLHKWDLRPTVIADLLKAKEEAESAQVRRKPRWLTLRPTLAEIAEWLSRPAVRYAVDIETAVGQISDISFARSDIDAISIPFHDETQEDLSYWRSMEDECRAWRLVEQGLLRPIPKIFQNGIFDLSYLLRMGFRPVMCEEDTMLLHHSLYPELPKGLGFLGSVYGNEVAWKQYGKRPKQSIIKRDE